MDARARMVAFFLSASVTQAIAAEAGAKRIHLSDYQSFVKNWSPEETPLCAAMDSRADWDAVMHPAPTMGQTRPFSPPEAFWKRNSLLVLARVINSGGDDLDVFQVDRVVRSKSKTCSLPAEQVLENAINGKGCPKTVFGTSSNFVFRRQGCESGLCGICL